VTHGYARPKRAFIDDVTPYEADFRARVFVSMYPNGATLETVGAMFDVTRERIRQIEQSAIERSVRACDRLGVSLETVFGPHGAEFGSLSDIREGIETGSVEP